MPAFFEHFSEAKALSIEHFSGIFPEINIFSTEYIAKIYIYLRVNEDLT